MLSFSTCWNSSRHTDGDVMLREITELGFDQVELGHGIRISLMPGIQKMYDAGEVKFTSLHNFCPLPVEVMHASPDCYLLSTSHTRERDRAIKQTFQTIDFAARLGAPFVVLHLGEIPMGPITDSLIKLTKEGKLLTREFVQKKLDAVKKREEMAGPYIERVRAALKPIAEYAKEKKIRLGLEGRRGYEEIPSEREFPALFDELDPAVCGYWHDLGHIQIKENLFLLNHEDWLKQMTSRTFGCHVQDCIWPAQDHQVPFAGDVDLKRLVPLLPRDCTMVWELSPRKTAVEIRRGLEKWKETFGE